MSKRNKSLPLGCIIKGILVIGIIMVGVFVFLNCSGGSCVKKIDQTLPTIAEAPWSVVTPTHLYYSQNVTQIKTGVVMVNWWVQSNNKWVYHKDKIELPFSVYGNIQVTRR
jgi:hypothetical protein